MSGRDTGSGPTRGRNAKAFPVTFYERAKWVDGSDRQALVQLQVRAWKDGLAGRENAAERTADKASAGKCCTRVGGCDEIGEAYEHGRADGLRTSEASIPRGESSITGHRAQSRTTGCAETPFVVGDRVRMKQARAREVRNDGCLTGEVIGVSGLSVFVKDNEGDTCEWMATSLERASGEAPVASTVTTESLTRLAFCSRCAGTNPQDGFEHIVDSDGDVVCRAEIRASDSKRTDKVLRRALGQDLWNRLWGPELEQLGGAVDALIEERLAERRSEADQPEALKLSTSAVRGLYSVAGIEPGDELALMAELARRLGTAPRSADVQPEPMTCHKCGATKVTTPRLTYCGSGLDPKNEHEWVPTATFKAMPPCICVSDRGNPECARHGEAVRDRERGPSCDPERSESVPSPGGADSVSPVSGSPTASDTPQKSTATSAPPDAPRGSARAARNASAAPHVCPFGHVAGCPQFGFEMACGRAECLAVDPLPRAGLSSCAARDVARIGRVTDGEGQRFAIIRFEVPEAVTDEALATIRALRFTRVVPEKP